MAFQLSPGVNVSEIDLTTVVPAVGTTEGAFAGDFNWGPINEIKTISSEIELVSTFGKPTNNTFTDFFTAANFLSYARNLKVVRSSSTELLNAVTTGLLPLSNLTVTTAGTNLATNGKFFLTFTSTTGGTGANGYVLVSNTGSGNAVNSAVLSTGGTGYANGTVTITIPGLVANTGANAVITAVISGANGTGILIENELDYKEQHSTGANTNGTWAAKWAGDLGNSLQVSLYASPNVSEFTAWTYSGNFDSAPGTSSYAANLNGVNDELHVVVIDEDGKFSGTANTILERFSNLSKATDAKTEDGSSNYYVDVINDRSKYIWWLSHPAEASSWGSTAQGANFGLLSNNAVTVSLTGGSFGLAESSDLTGAYDKFKNADEVDISLIMTSDHASTVVSHAIENIAEYRKDCIAFLSPERADVIDNVGSETTDAVAFRNTLTSSSYAFMDSGWKYQFDKYNNTYRWVPLNGDIAGLCVRTDFERDPWFSPAGFNRGIIRNVTKLAWNPDKTDRDELYKKGINPVVSFPGEGTILYGDKTLLSKPSAFDRINVRRLFIVLEKAIARAAKFSLFEFNDAFTRAQFIALVEPFLRDVQGRRGIYDFRVVCDETNNTPEVIDRNEFIGDIYIKPARSINFIQLNFVAVRTGVSFDEIVGRF